MDDHQRGTRTGRPRERRVDWIEAERLYREGASTAEIARRFGCTRQNVHRHARARWAQVPRAPAAPEASAAVAPARSAAPLPDDAEPMTIVDAYLDLFKSALAAGRVRHDAINDLAIAVKLKQALVGEAQARVERDTGLPSLAELQERHRRARARLSEIERLPALAGIVSPATEGFPLDV